MTFSEIEIPKEVREFMLNGAQETILGKKNGASKQYRYGNLHIREFDDKFLVHMDKIDPRINPIGHLINDAPEILIGLACATFCGLLATKKNKTNSNKFLFSNSFLSSIFAGYLGYEGTKKFKKLMEK